MQTIGRDGDAYLVADGPVGAIVGPDLPVPPMILPVASLLAHRQFDDYDGRVPARLLPDELADTLAAARVRFEAGDPATAQT